MHHIFDCLTTTHGWVTITTGIGSAFAAAFAFSAKLRRAVIIRIMRKREHHAILHGLAVQVNELVERVSEVNDKCASNANALSEIKKELTFNGGQSTKDYLARLESYRRHQFWLQPRPCFECDVHGRNTIVSEAYCLLVNASNEAALLGLNWRQFIYIEDEPTYYASFKTSSDSLSAFRGHIRLSDPDGEYRGQWEVRAVPLLPSSEKTSYVGYLRPLDDIAKALAVDSRWGH